MSNMQMQKSGFMNDLKFYFLLSRRASQIEYWVITLFFAFMTYSSTIMLELASKQTYLVAMPVVGMILIFFGTLALSLANLLTFVCWLTVVWRRVLTLGWKMSTLIWVLIPGINFAFFTIVGLIPDRKN